MLGVFFLYFSAGCAVLNYAARVRGVRTMCVCVCMCLQVEIWGGGCQSVSLTRILSFLVLHLSRRYSIKSGTGVRRQRSGSVFRSWMFIDLEVTRKKNVVFVVAEVRGPVS